METCNCLVQFRILRDPEPSGNDQRSCQDNMFDSTTGLRVKYWIIMIKLYWVLCEERLRSFTLSPLRNRNIHLNGVNKLV